MNKEEFKECSVVAYPREIKFLHINGGAISYYVDRHVSDYVDRLQQENQKYKEVIDKIMNLIKQYGKYDGKKCTRGFQMWSADFNKILDILKEVE